MAGFGFGFGSHSASSQYAVLGQNGAPAILSPAALWNGTEGSGFGGTPPVDPARTTAKPACRLLVPQNQFFTDELVVGVWAGANFQGSMLDNLGLEKVIVHCEGNTVDVLAPSFYLFADANGNPVRYLGWWAVLKHSGISGHAQVYFEAVPKDPTMQKRVMGPYRFSPQAILHDYQITIAATPAEIAGVRYKTFLAAFNYLRTQSAQNPRITVTEAGNYDLLAMNTIYSGKGYCRIDASVPFSIKKPGFSTGSARLFRPRYDGLWFSGDNITIDFHHADAFHHENVANTPHVFDGIKFTDTGGDYYTYLLGRKVTFQAVSNSAFFLECNIDTIPNPCTLAALVRGCLIEGVSNDIAQNSFFIIGTTIRNCNSDAWRAEIPAMTVQYTGPGATATLSLAGGNLTNNRVMTAKVAGTTVGTFTLLNTEAGFNANTNYTVQNVVSWLNSLAGWSASLLDNSRYAVALAMPGTGGTAMTDVDVKTQKTLVTMLDIHADLWQHVGPSENRIFIGNTCYNNAVQSLFIFNVSRDIMLINNTFHQDPNSPNSLPLLSQISLAQSHLVVAHNTSANQQLALRTDVGMTSDSYCLLANNVWPNIVWIGPTLTTFVMTNNHIFENATNPVGATGTTIGGTASTLIASASTGNFAPSGPLLSILKTPVVRHDTAGAERTGTAPPGAKTLP